MSSIASTASIGPSVYLSGNARILMVDDQPARLLTYESILSDLPVECVRAHSGFEALERLLKQEFAAILLDVNMPGMDGFEVARLIRERPRSERIPIIFITGVNMTELDRLKGYEVGAIDYMPIPVVPEILRTKVAVLVELQNRRAQLQDLNRQLEEARHTLELQHSRALAEREGQLRGVFEHPHQFMLIMAAVRNARGEVTDWQCRDANAYARRLLGVSRDQTVGRRVEELFPQRAAEICMPAAGVLGERKPAGYDFQYGQRVFSVTCYAMDENSVVVAGLDVTQARQTELRLRASERSHHALLDNAPVAVAHNGMDGRFQYVNEAFSNLVGYAREELYNKTWQEITHPEDLESDQALGYQVLSGQIPDYTLEKRYVRKDRTEVWVRLFGNFVLDDADRPILGVAVAIDVTQQRQAASALRQSEQRVLLAKAAAGLGIHDWDLQSGLIQWDERLRELWGLPSDEVITYASFIEGVHPEDRDSTQNAVDKALDPAGDGTYAAKYRVVARGTGALRWVEATGRVYFEQGQAKRLIGIVRDITEQHNSLERLEKSELRFRELANNIDQFVWTCDEAGHPTWYNDRWYEYTGTTFEEMRGVGWHHLNDPAHAERVIANLRESFASGRAWEDTFPLRGKDGTYRWFLSRAVPIKDGNGRVLRWFGTNTDITEQRLLKEQLEQADQRKDEFLAMLAHELRNPVAPIRTAAEVLTRILPDEKRARASISVIQRQTVHLSRLLDDLLDVARINHRQIDLKREVLDLRSCIDAAIETAEPAVRAKSQRLSVIHATEPLYVSVDATRISLCIANVVSNSARYTEAGGEIRIECRAGPGSASIVISDTGVGISAEFLPKVFDLFSQAGRSLDRSQGGLGLGMYICREFIQMHGGTVTAASAGPGLGSTFTIRLPLCDAPHPRCEPTIAGPLQLKRVLIVDDNTDAADSLAELLQMSGHQISAVYSAERGLIEIERFQPHVVLLDIGLPHMDG